MTSRLRMYGVGQSIAALSLTLAVLPPAALAVCDSIHGPDALTVRLGWPGTETLQKAYSTIVLRGGGVIEVPYGIYQCQAIWAAARRAAYRDVTIRGLPGPNGEKPVFGCAKGVWIALGPPMYAQDGVTPDPTVPARLMIEGIEVSGWSNWIRSYNHAGLILRDVRMHNADRVAPYTGKGVSNSERIGPKQSFDVQICGSEFSHAGGGNVDHPLYLHGGFKGGFGRLTMQNSFCHHARGSHCIKAYTNEVRLIDNLFWNPCENRDTCGTELVDVGSPVESVVRGNKIVSANVIGTAMSYTLSRKYRPPTDQGPLFTPHYDDPEYHAYEFWEMVRAAGVDDTLPDPPSAKNPHLRKHFWSGNVFHNTGTRPLPAISAFGTYPIESLTYASNCVRDLKVPHNWHELSRMYVANNIFIGPMPAQPIVGKHPNFCKLQRPEAMVLTPVVDVGGNGPPGTPPVKLPEWFKQ